MVLEGLQAEFCLRPCGRRESFVLAADTRNLFRFHETRSRQLLGFLFGLAPDGVFRAALLALRAVRSYRTFSPLPPAFAAGGLIFFGTFRPKDFLLSSRVYLRSKPELRGIAPCGVRTFLFRLAPKAILRPSKTSETITDDGKISRL